MKKRIQLSNEEAISFGFKLNSKSKGKPLPRYTLSDEQYLSLMNKRGVSVITATSSNDYEKPKFVISAWGEDGVMMDIDSYCVRYGLPRGDISSYKLVSHTSTPYYNIVFKENIITASEDFDIEGIVKKHIKPLNIKVKKVKDKNKFDNLTYTDVHVGMDTNKDGNSMYAEEWNRESVLKSAKEIIKRVLSYKESDTLVIDELGDLLDGYNGKTTRGGHDLPQNMTNEEAFDCALEFKMMLLNGFVGEYKRVLFNNVCNDNHAGSFGYFVNSAFKQIADIQYKNVNVTNHRTFMSHYFINDVCFVISHGKDDSALKFGFKPQLDTKQIEKIDQYIKHNNIYGNCKRIIFKKGDSHQCLFDMSSTDDFDYFNYPALSPSSKWVQTNYKKGRRGFVVDNFNGVVNKSTTIFI